MTALDHPARAGNNPRIPFPTVDEIARHCSQTAEPETVHIEVHLPGPLNPERLRTAFAEALHHHPRILMREAPGPWYRRRYEWELTKTPDIEAVTFPPPTRDALAQARTRSLTHTPPLTASPPIRLEAVPLPQETGTTTGTPTRTVLILTVNHTALDGPACLRILATAAERYGGRDNPPTAPPPPPPPPRPGPPGAPPRAGGPPPPPGGAAAAAP
ncbi:condensation protein, partial [Streptomyces sp. NPDC058469]